MVDIRKLSNGITVVLEPMEYLKTVAFGVWVKVGSLNETKENNGISHVIEHMMFKGTTNRNARQIADDMAMIGGNVNAYTCKEYTSYYSVTLSEHLPKAIEIISDMLLHSEFAEDQLEREKGVILEEIDMYDDSPEDLVHEMLQQEIWKDHPLGFIISGTKENVQSMTRKDLFEFLDRNYIAENMILSVAGKFDVDSTCLLLEEAFASVKHGKAQLKVVEPTYHQCIYQKEKDIEQVHLNIAFDSIRYDSKEKYILTILNSILGGGINSRLFLTIREDMGLTYTIYSYGSSHMDAGLYHIYAAMNPSQTFTVYQAIFDVINELIEDGVDDNELIMNIEQIKTDLVLASESAKSRMSSNAKAIMTRGKVIDVQEILTMLNRITKQDIIDFAKKYFVKEKASIAIVGNISGLDIDIMKQQVNL